MSLLEKHELAEYIITKYNYQKLENIVKKGD